LKKGTSIIYFFTLWPTIVQRPLNITISKQRCKNKQIPVYKTQNFQVSITIAVTVQKKL